MLARETPRALAIWVRLSPEAWRARAAASRSGSMTVGASTDPALGFRSGEAGPGALVGKCFNDQTFARYRHKGRGHVPALELATDPSASPVRALTSFDDLSESC